MVLDFNLFGTGTQSSTPSVMRPPTPLKAPETKGQAIGQSISSAVQSVASAPAKVLGGVAQTAYNTATYPSRYLNTPVGQQTPFSTGIQPIAPFYPTPTGTQPTGIQLNSKQIEQAKQAVNPASSSTPSAFGFAQPDTRMTPSGALVSTDGTVIKPANQFSVSVPSTVTSDMLGTGKTVADVMQKRSNYEEAVRALQGANQFSPDYVRAQESFLGAQNRMRELATGAYYNPQGDTQGFNEGFYSREKAMAGLDVDRANQSLQVQALIRQGDIAGAKAVVDAMSPSTLGFGQSIVNPVTGETIASGASYTDKQAYDTFYNLAQTYPDALLQYNPNLTPQQNLDKATQGVTNSASYQAKNFIEVSLPNGGTMLVDKRQVSIGSDGKMTLLSSAEGALGKASGSALREQQQYLSQIRTALTTADTNFENLVSFAKEKGINTSLPVINELKNRTKYQLGDADVTAFQSGLAEIATEYGRVFSKGGQVTDEVRRNSEKIISGDMSIKQLEATVKQIKAQGEVAIKASESEINKLQNQLRTGSTSSAGGGGLWNF